jgi:uncharacterized protein YebE (UPF0316 family)
MGPPLLSHSLLVPLLVFLAEMTVVTLGTLRIICISRGRKHLAPLLGFFEVLTWLFAITQVMTNLGEWDCVVAFALGFTLGNYLGMAVEQRLALGSVVVRAFFSQDPTELVTRLRSSNYGVTCVEGKGSRGPVQIVMTVIKRKQLEVVMAMIKTSQPGAFCAVDDLQDTCSGIFPTKTAERGSLLPVGLRVFRRPEPLEKTG